MEAQDNKTGSINSCQSNKIKTHYPIELKCLVHPKEKANNVKNPLNPKSHQDFFGANSWSWTRSQAESNI